MLGLAGSWACRGLLRQQQRGQAKQQMLLLLAFLVDCCIGVSASAHLRCSISNNTGARFASFVGGTWSCPSFRRAFLAPASSSKSADKPNSLWTSLKPQHVNCRRMHNEVASRNTRPEGLVRAYPTRWVMEPGAHREGGPTFSKQSMLLRSFPVDTTIYGGPLTLLMRAHVHRSHSRLGRPASHRKALLRNLATQLIRHGSIITTAAKGKELRRVIDSKIVLAKKGGLHNYRQALGFFYDKKLTRSLFQQIKYTSTTTPPFFIIYPKYLSVCCVRYEGPNKVRTKKQRIL